MSYKRWDSFRPFETLVGNPIISMTRDFLHRILLIMGYHVWSLQSCRWCKFSLRRLGCIKHMYIYITQCDVEMGKTTWDGAKIPMNWREFMERLNICINSFCYNFWIVLIQKYHPRFQNLLTSHLHWLNTTIQVTYSQNHWTLWKKRGYRLRF